MECFWKDLGEVNQPGEYYTRAAGPIEVTLSNINCVASMEGNILCTLGARAGFGPTGVERPGSREKWVIETMTEVPDDYELPLPALLVPALLSPDLPPELPVGATVDEK